MDVYEAIAVQDAGMILVPLYEKELDFLASLLHVASFFAKDEEERKLATSLLQTLKNYGA